MATQLSRIEANVLTILTIQKNAAAQAQTQHAAVLAAISSLKEVAADGLAAIANRLDEIEQIVNGVPDEAARLNVVMGTPEDKA